MLKDMKIIVKTTLLSSILLLFCAIIGVSGFLFTKNSNNNLSSMYNNDLQAIIITDDMRLQARTTQYAMLRYIIEEDQEAKDKLKLEIESKMDNVESDIAAYKLLNLPKAEQDEMLQIEESYNLIKDTVYNFTNVIDSPALNEAKIKESTLDLVKTLDNFRSQANALMKKHLENTDVTYAKTEVANSGAVISLLLILAIAIVLGSVLTYLIVMPITKSLKSATQYLEVISTGDFTSVIPSKLLNAKDEIGDMLRAVDKMQGSIRMTLSSVIEESHRIEELIDNTDQNVGKLSFEIQEVSATTEELSAGMEETAATTEIMNTTSTEIQDTIGAIKSKANDTVESSSRISDRANEVKSNAVASKESADSIYASTNTNLRDAIEQAKAVNQINVLLEAILEVTSQTNLLALNAAIEAGKGFAVVADEIRKLAENSGDNVNKIQEVIQVVLSSVNNLADSSMQILEFVDKSVATDYSAMVKTGEQYNEDANSIYTLSNDFLLASNEISNYINSMAQSIQGITNASHEGAEGTTNIALKTSNIARMVVEITNETKEIKSKANALAETVAQFKI
ncbi:MAG TPA: methyl-accepting chemotaxis protein [Epulopiscium sp.]|nr:methyl-accepting chemotaxis protein [Candidatus Epulonipiscium sp.]